MPSYRDTLRYLYGIERRGIRPGLKRIEALVSALGKPHREYPSVLVAGTNGKGSTSAMITSVLNEAGFKVGLFTSPHLVRFNERIRIGNSEITDREVASVAEKVRATMEKTKACRDATFFEVTTAMAFEYFKEKNVDLAVLEVGMGGRLDATNVVTPLVSVITNIGYDHERFLGKDVGGIAVEKAGVIKEGSPVVCGVEGARTAGLIQGITRKRGSEFYLMGRDFGFVPSGRMFDYWADKNSFKGLGLNLRGPHQLKNASCATKALELLWQRGFNVREKALRRGFKKVVWPGRFEVLTKTKTPAVVLDCAHNVPGAEALAHALGEFRFKRLFIVLGVMVDKDIAGIARSLLPLAHTVILTQPRVKRAAPVDMLGDEAGGYARSTLARKTVSGALRLALKEAAEEDAVCVTGSVFTVGEARRYLERVFHKV